MSTIASFNVTTADTAQGGLITKSRSIPAGYGSLKRDLKAFIALARHSRKNRLSNTQIWAGFLFLTPGGKLLSCFLPCFVENAAGKKVVMGTKSNNPSKPTAMILPVEILDHVLIISKKASAPSDTVWGPNPVDLDNPDIGSILPSDHDWSDCYIGRIPAVLPIPYGTEEAITGKLSDQSVLDFLEDVLEDKEASIWADCLHQAPAQDLAKTIRATPAFTPFLPPMPQKHICLITHATPPLPSMWTMKSSRRHGPLLKAIATFWLPPL